jgi:acyl carrier protein
MPTAETLNRVKRVICMCLKVDEGTMLEDTMPLVGGEYDLDSLDILLIITELEKEFGVKIREGEMSKATFESIESLCAFIESLPSAGQDRVS